MSFHETIVMGRIGSEPKIYHSQDGGVFIRFTVAVNEKIGSKDHTEWYNVLYGSKHAQEVADRMQKGGRVLVVGRLRTQEYTDKNGQGRRSTTLLAANIRLIDQRAVERQQDDGREKIPLEQSKKAANQKENESYDEEDVPF